MKDNNQYIYSILEQLLKSNHKKTVRNGHLKNGRRISLKIPKVYAEYEKLNADIGLKSQVNEAVRTLEAMGYITVKRLPYSDDVQNIYLCEDQIPDIERYMEKQFGITARHYILEDIRDLIREYAGKGTLTGYYCNKLSYRMEHSAQEMDADRERELLKILAFIQDNENDLYVREVSALVYGNSKYFENERRYEEVCNIIREADGQPKRENEQNDEILQQYHISNVGQDISVKGDFLIEIGEYRLETKYFSGGLSLSSEDIERIGRITVRTQKVMTVENKTSYYRYAQPDCSLIYLGGYANRHQIEMIKKIYEGNKDCEYLHFGDIDVGGFLIHQHLCSATGIAFQLFCMGCGELEDKKYRQALLPLTENDIARAQKLMAISEYQGILAKMLDKGVKLEQEIVSYSLMR